MIDTLMVELSRWQFAITSLYHFIFVPLTLGISWIVFIMETMYVLSNKTVYKDMCLFWGKLFAINFAIGVATGITMEFEFGTNWSNYSHYVGDIFGAPLAIEALLAFFLESTMIGLMFAGWNRFGKKTHWVITFLTALGSNLSAMWILIANGWMQYPEFAQFSPEHMRMEMADFFGLVFSPVGQAKFTHVVCGGYLTAAMFVVSISAYFMLKGRDLVFAKRSMTIGLAFGFCAMGGAALTGDMSAVLVTEHQPEKLAAMEAEYEPQEAPASWSLIAIPNEKELKNDFSIQVPALLGLIATHSFDQKVLGLKDIIDNNEKRIVDGIKAHVALQMLRSKNYTDEQKAQALEVFNQYKKDLGYGLLLVEHAKNPLSPTVDEIKAAARASVPSVWVNYFSFRIMIGLLSAIAVLMLGAAFYLWYKKDLLKRAWLLKLLMLAIPLPFIACEFGWVLAEMGRQPWAIQGILPTYLATSSLDVTDLMISIPFFVIVYTIFLIIEMRLMVKSVQKGPYGEEVVEAQEA